MNQAKRERLEKAGWIFEDAEDFLELTEEERRLVELRLDRDRAGHGALKRCRGHSRDPAR